MLGTSRNFLIFLFFAVLPQVANFNARRITGVGRLNEYYYIKKFSNIQIFWIFYVQLMLMKYLLLVDKIYTHYR